MHKSENDLGQNGEVDFFGLFYIDDNCFSNLVHIRKLVHTDIISSFVRSL